MGFQRTASRLNKKTFKSIKTWLMQLHQMLFICKSVRDLCLDYRYSIYILKMKCKLLRGQKSLTPHGSKKENKSI